MSKNQWTVNFIFQWDECEYTGTWISMCNHGCQLVSTAVSCYDHVKVEKLIMKVNEKKRAIENK